MKFKRGDTVEVEGYLCEVIKVTESYIEVLYGGEALHYCVEKYDINFTTTKCQLPLIA